MLHAISDKLGSIDCRLDEMDDKWKFLSSRFNNKMMPGQVKNEATAELKEQVPQGNCTPREVDPAIKLVEVKEDEFSEAQKELLDMGIVMEDKNKIPPKLVSCLLRVPENADLREFKPHPTINKKTLKNILPGEYCELELMLPPKKELIKVKRDYSN